MTVALPAVAEVTRGAWAIPLPMPDNPLRYVFAYAFELEGGGVLLIDSGWDAPGALPALEAGLATLGVGLDDVRGLALTHIHPDHYGLAGAIRARSGAWVGLHPDEAALVQTRYEDVSGLLDRVAGWLRAAGTPEVEVGPLTTSSMEVLTMVAPAPDFKPIEDGDRLDAPGWGLVALHTPGHSPGHLCFHDAARGILVTGDHILPRITPNVSLHPQSGPDPLGDYLASLERLSRLGPLLGLPGHGGPIGDVSTRAGELVRHHERQLELVRGLVVAGCETAYAVAERFPWRRRWERITGHMRRAAIGEVYAHLVVLETRRLAVRSGAAVLRWRPAE